MKSALSAKVRDGELIVLDKLAFEKPKTKNMVAVLKNLKVDRKALVVGGEFDETVWLSARNIPGVKYLAAHKINVLDVLRHDKLIMTQDAVAKVEEVLGK